MKKLTAPEPIPTNLAELEEKLANLSDEKDHSVFVAVRNRLIIAYHVGLLRFEKDGRSTYKPVVRLNRDMAVAPDNSDLYMVLGADEKVYPLHQLLTIMEFDYGKLVEIDAQNPKLG